MAGFADNLQLPQGDAGNLIIKAVAKATFATTYSGTVKQRDHIRGRTSYSSSPEGDRQSARPRPVHPCGEELCTTYDVEALSGHAASTARLLSGRRTPLKDRRNLNSRCFAIPWN